MRVLGAIRGAAPGVTPRKWVSHQLPISHEKWDVKNPIRWTPKGASYSQSVPWSLVAWTWVGQLGFEALPATKSVCLSFPL